METAQILGRFHGTLERMRSEARCGLCDATCIESRCHDPRRRRVPGAATVAAVWISMLLAGCGQPQSAGDGGSEDSARAELSDERSAVVSFWETYRAATRARIEGDLVHARDLYEVAVVANDRHEDAWYYLGNIRLELGDTSGGRQALERLVEVNPESVRGLVSLGDVHQCVESDTAAAARRYKQALQTNPEETGPQIRLGRLALLREDWRAAERLLAAVTTSNFKSVEGFYLLGYLAWRSGNWDAAREALAEAVRLTSSSPAGEPLGEGDTRAGSKPLARRSATCEAWTGLASGLDAVSGDPDLADATAFFDEVDRRIAGMR